MRSADEVISQFSHLLPPSHRLGLGCPVGPGRCGGIGGWSLSGLMAPGALEKEVRQRDEKCALVHSFGLIIFVGLWL